MTPAAIWGLVGAAFLALMVFFITRINRTGDGENLVLPLLAAFICGAGMLTSLVVAVIKWLKE